jgi:NAD(P)H-dependent flavin oxidoreductase YrpB (nitropropane dioxygenase family)
MREQLAAIRTATTKPFGVNFLLFVIEEVEASFAAALEARPPVVSFARARPDQDLRAYVQRVHEAGLLAMHMAGEVPEAVRAAEAGVDVIVAQGTEGGGHVGWMASMAVVPMVVQAVAPLPVLAAGGIADGRGMAAALALVPKVSCWAHASWPPTSHRCTRTSSRPLCAATVITPY